MAGGAAGSNLAQCSVVRGDGMTSPSGSDMVWVRRCLSRSTWLRKQGLGRSLTVLDPALGGV